MKADELDALLADVEETATEGETDADAVPETPSEPKSERGKVYQLGRHRVMCGDSTKTEDVARLMGGERADIMFTSPPYNMNKNPLSDKCPNKAMRSGAAYVEYGDDKDDSSYSELLIKSTKIGLDCCDDAIVNIGILENSKIGIINLLNELKGKFCDIIVWNKSQSMPLGLPSHKKVIGHRCELIFCFNQTGSRAFTHSQWEAGKMINRIDTNSASQNEFAKIHGATFPIDLPIAIIQWFTEKSVLDLFCGTGTTIIAAEKKNRVGYGMELSPQYVDVIRRRWAEFVHGEGCDWERLTPEITDAKEAAQ